MRTWTLTADMPAFRLQVLVQDMFPGQIAPQVTGGRYATVSVVSDGPPEWMKDIAATFAGEIVGID